MISAVSPRGDFRFMVVAGAVTAEIFIDFMKRLLIGSKKKVFLIVDGHPTHRSMKAKEFKISMRSEIELFFLPPFSPELNPDELAWNVLKNGIVGKSTVKDKGDLKSKVVPGLRKIQTATQKVKAFFQHPKTQYAA